MNYQRLPGKGRFFFSQHVLWMGEDHLLAVKSSGYSEQYTRYYFKDILAIITHRTNGYQVRNIVFGVLLGLALICLAISLMNDLSALAIICGALAVLFLLLLFRNIRLGDTCRCNILTTLGNRELPSVRRTKQAGEIFNRIRPCILDKQGTIPSDDSAIRQDSTVGAGRALGTVTGENSRGIQRGAET